jgi:hypothetical protein
MSLSDPSMMSLGPVNNARDPSMMSLRQGNPREANMSLGPVNPRESNMMMSLGPVNPREPNMTMSLGPINPNTNKPTRGGAEPYLVDVWANYPEGHANPPEAALLELGAVPPLEAGLQASAERRTLIQDSPSNWSQGSATLTPEQAVHLASSMANG